MSGTIFAQASARGRAGVALVRISGPGAFGAVRALAGSLPPPRQASVRRLRSPASGEGLDEGLVIGFPGPASFTGEDVAELQLHGSPAVVRSVLAALGALPGLRAAEPGEFTRRALANGRLDLAQVEGLADLIEAETEAQQRQALRLMQGTLSAAASTWRRELLQALALLEAGIDFADEELPENLPAGAASALERARDSMAAQARGGAAAERIREGFEVALVGAPNVGKSTLLNAIAGRDAALTSEVAGTTRDVIEVRLDLEGLPVTLLDLAGLREAEERVEALGIARARERAERADLRLFLESRPGEAAALGVARRSGDLLVGAKADLAARPGLAVSGLTGHGVDVMLSAVAVELGRRASAASTLTRERQRVAIERAVAAVDAALGQVATAPELAAGEVREALGALDFLIGKVDVEAVLDTIFASFCLGK